jgi:hypothetical protein
LSAYAYWRSVSLLLAELKAMSQWLDGQRGLISLVAGDLRRQEVRLDLAKLQPGIGAAAGDGRRVSPARGAGDLPDYARRAAQRGTVAAAVMWPMSRFPFS